MKRNMTAYKTYAVVARAESIVIWTVSAKSLIDAKLQAERDGPDYSNLDSDEPVSVDIKSVTRRAKIQ